MGKGVMLRGKKQENIYPVTSSDLVYDLTKKKKISEQLIEIESSIEDKVSKEEGKKLSSNDYTNTDKNKLDGIESGAQVNSVTGVKGDNESSYRIGDVNITKENVGLGNVDNTPDSEKNVNHANTANEALKSESDGNGNNIVNTYSTKYVVEAIEQRVTALSQIQSNFIGYYAESSVLPTPSENSWALVGDLSSVQVYAYYTTNNIPTGYSAGWNPLTVLGTYDLTDYEEIKSKVSKLDSLRKYIGVTSNGELNNMIPELYLTGLDDTRVYQIYRINNGGTSRYIHIYDADTSNQNRLLATAYTTDFSLDILKVEEENGSGINGYIVVNWNIVPSGDSYYFEPIRHESVTSLANNPLISTKLEHDHNINSIEGVNKSIEENNLKINDLNKRLTDLDGLTESHINLNDLGIRRSGYYINKNDGKQYVSSTAVITKAIYLKEGDKIKAYTGGSGFGLIAFTDTLPDDYTIYTVIHAGDNLTSPVTINVEQEGYYSFSGRNSEQGDLSLAVDITKYEKSGGSVTELYEGKIVGSKQYTLDDLDGDGSLIDWYLHHTNLIPIGSSDVIITAPIYLHKGDKINCSTGGTGFLLVAKSPSGIIDRYTKGFISVSGTDNSYEGVIDEDGWYVFSGRINRIDGTNLVVNITAYTRTKSIFAQLDEKVSKNELSGFLGGTSSHGGNGFALSIGADSVKDPIPSTPWFNNVDNDGTTYGTYLDDKIDSVPQGDSFIFISDVHYPGNKKNSAKLIDYVRRRLGIKTIIHGGDVINEASVMADAAKEWLDFNRDFVFRIGGDFKQACGDHDHNGRYADSGQAFSYQFVQRVMNGYNIKELVVDTIYDEQVEERAVREGWTDFERKEYDAWKKMHYYFDDSTINTRFILLHTGWTGDVGLAVDKLGSDVLSEASALHLQMDFLYDALNSCPKGMNVVVVGHNTIGNKEYKVSIDGGSASRYNVNEPVWKGLWQNVAKMIRAFKDKGSVILNYRDWSGEGLKSKTFDYSGSQTPEFIFCMGGDVHWDIMCKSTSDSETLEVVAEATSLDNIIVPEGTISSSDILHALTMTDGGDRGYRGIIAPPSSNYNDNVDSVLVSPPNTEGTLDSQAFDVVTIAKNAIYFTRIGSGNDRVVYISD